MAPASEGFGNGLLGPVPSGRCGGSLVSVMTEIDPQTEALVPAWLTLPDVAEQLGVDTGRVRSMLRDRHLIAVRRGPDGVLHVPAAFVRDGKVLKGLPGTLTLLADAGYDEVESIRWLFTSDESLPGCPVTAIEENRGTEVRRRAQALAF
jgi:Rv2175c C-terminal domain of unknown function